MKLGKIGIVETVDGKRICFTTVDDPNAKEIEVLEAEPVKCNRKVTQYSKQYNYPIYAGEELK